MSDPSSFFLGLLPVLGGVTGLAWLCYMVVMVLYARKKDHDIQELRVVLAEVRGLLYKRR